MTILHVAVYMTDLKVPQGVDGTREDSRLSGHYSDVDDRDIKAGLQRHDIWREQKKHCTVQDLPSCCKFCIYRVEVNVQDMSCWYFWVNTEEKHLKNLQQSCNVVILVITAIDTIKKYSLQIRAIQGWRFFLTIDI